MQNDFRAAFVKDVEAALVTHYDTTQVAVISNIIIKVLDGYEITDRCTEVVPLDDTNERLLKNYCACLLVDGKSKGTIRQYTLSCRKLSDAIGKPYTEIGVYDLRYFFAKEMERGVSARTRENTRANLSAFFQWLTIEEIIPKNPMASLKPIKYNEEVRKAFSDVEIDALRSACNSLKERALVEFLLTTGARVSEVEQMQVQDIDMATLAVHIKHGKGDKSRITYTNAVAMRHLLAYINSRKEQGTHLFYNKDHNPLCAGGIRRILANIGKRAGVGDVHPHRFRRTFATNLARRGMDVQQIQRLMGHSNLNTTMIYVQVDDSSISASYKVHIA